MRAGLKPRSRGHQTLPLSSWQAGHASNASDTNFRMAHCGTLENRMHGPFCIGGMLQSWRSRFGWGLRTFPTWLMRTFQKTARIALLIAALAGAQLAHAQHPADRWEFALETGYLTKIKNNSPFDYRIVPTQAVWRTPPMFDLWRGTGGERLVVRNRMAAVAETIRRGPEDYYVAFAGSPTFELWSADQKSALFYEIGGGIGLVNSKHVPGGQGQNLTFNWFTQLGARRQLGKRMAVTAGAYFTHHSNRGMTNPNPGIDVLGANFGVIWQLD